MLRPGEYGIRTLSQNGTPKDRWKMQIIERKGDTICFHVSDPYMLGMLGNEANMKARLTIFSDRIEGNILYSKRGSNWERMKHVVMRPM